MDEALLHPVTREGLALLRRYGQRFGIRFRVTSGFRSIGRQRELYNLWKAGSPLQRLPVAPPGTSTHNYGLALDIVPVAPTTEAQLVELATAIGFLWGGKSDPVHFQVIDQDYFRQLLRNAGIV